MVLEIWLRKMKDEEKIRRVHVILKNMTYLIDAFKEESRDQTIAKDVRFVASLKYENLQMYRDSIVRIIEDLI